MTIAACVKDPLRSPRRLGHGETHLAWEQIHRMNGIFYLHPDAQCMAYLPTFTIYLGQM